VNIEVHQVPGKGEPNQAEARKRNNEVVQLRPDPAARIAQAANRVQQDENGANRANDAQESKRNNPGGEAVDAVWIVNEGQHGEPSDIDQEQENANDADQQPHPDVRRSVVKLLALVLSDHGGYWPHKDGQAENAQPID